MLDYQEEFISFLLKAGALRFGEFTLKSGRKSPFFMNAGAFQTGGELKALGEFYAKAIHSAYGDEFDILFGPAYKGIPLSVACSIAFSSLYGREIRYCANRKELKDHGDAGILLGSGINPTDRVVIIEDVTTSGQSVEETWPILKAQGLTSCVGMMVMLDRGERGKTGKGSALSEISEKYGFPARAIVSMKEVREYLETKGFPDGAAFTEEMGKRMDSYYAEYGAQ